MMATPIGTSAARGRGPAELIAVRHTLDEMGVNPGYRQQAAGEDGAVPGC